MTQTRPGSTPLGRTVGLVAPTAAEYRQLGTNEPFLAALRTATGGSEVDDARRPVDSTTCGRRSRSPTSGRCCWSWRCCSGRWTSPCGGCRSGGASSRPLAPGSAGCRTVGAATAARTATGEGLLAARDRATSTEARAAMRRRADEAPPLPDPADPGRTGRGDPTCSFRVIACASAGAGGRCPCDPRPIRDAARRADRRHDVAPSGREAPSARALTPRRVSCRPDRSPVAAPRSRASRHRRGCPSTSAWPPPGSPGHDSR